MYCKVFFFLANIEIDTNFLSENYVITPSCDIVFPITRITRALHTNNENI